MKYNVTLDFKRKDIQVEAKSKTDACVKALGKVINEPKVTCETLFQKMVQAGMNESYVEELQS